MTLPVTPLGGFADQEEVGLPSTPLIFTEGGSDARARYDELELASLGASGDLESVGDMHIPLEVRRRLRLITKHVHLRHYPGDFLTDRECDKFISSWSRGYLERMKEEMF